MQQLQKDIAFRMQEKDDMILSYENKIIQLQKEFKDKLFLVDQSKQLDERHLLKQELANCHAEIISLKSKLEISEGTRKAIHETTISLLKQAQEESSKLALSHHERSLEVLRRELKGDLRPESPVKIKELEASLEQANVKIGQLNAKIQTLVAEKSELKTKAVQLQDERLLLDQELEQLRSLLERSKSGLPPSVQQFQQLVTKIQQLESELERRTEFLEHDPKDCQHEKDQLVNLLRQKDQDISKFQTKIASLLTGIQLLKSR
ncbi:hypothetical protein EDD86DRAFT_2336 [Gorgonomyces haynaldii]|nr:hypothetical protein EDD86DRAFT_2336 [Gorgonomyces haynaldii]